MIEKQKNRLADMNRQELLDHYQEIQEIALKDSLTGLLNRGALEREIDSRLKNMKETDSCALFIIDLDNFKAVNDNLGHQTGDQVLIKTAWILSGMFRASDVVGRLGGDEFVVFLQGNITENMVRAKGQMICDQILFVLGKNTEIIVSASVGIYLSAGQKQEFSFLYRSADLALYKAKKNGKQGYCIKLNDEDHEEAGEEVRVPVNAVRLRSLLDYIDSGVAMIELKDSMEFVYISPSFARMAGEKTEELIKTPLENMIYPEDRPEVERLLRENVMEKNETVSHVVRVAAKGGKLFWWRLHAVRVEYSEKRPVVLATETDITELKEKESSLQMNNELFRIAIDQTSQGIWEVDLESHTFRLMGENRSFSPVLRKPNYFPEELIRNGWVHPESAEGFRDFADEIFSGRTQGYGNFKIRYLDDGQYTWASFSYRTVSEDGGRPLRAVGLIEVMNQGNPEGERQPKGAVLPESLMASLVFQVSGNLTQDTVHQCWLEGRDVTGEASFLNFTDVLIHESKRAFLPEKRKNFSEILSRDSLLLAYMERKKHWLMYEYQREDSDGNIRRVSCVVNLYSDSRNQDVHMAMWLNQLDKRYQWETQFGIDIYKDPATRLYTRTTVRELSHRILEAQEHKLCALILVEIGGMARLYARYAGSMDEKWKAVIYSLLLTFGTYCIPGQFATDRYVFFFPEITSQDTLKRKLEQAFLFVRSITSDLVDGNLLRFTAAGVCRYQDETDYDILMKKAQVICQYWSNSSGDRVVFADEEREEKPDLFGVPGISDQIRMPREEIARPLSDREKDAAFSCILKMLGVDSLEESSRCVLETLGEYYEADRTYILVTVEGGHIVTMPHEWTSVHKRSIQQTVSGMMTDRLPLLSQCARENKPVFLTRHFPLENQDDGKEEEPWHYAIFPMRDEDGIQGYLCIENPKAKVSDAVLPSLLSSCLLKERKKYMRSSGGITAENGAAAFELPDSSSYMKAIYGFTSDMYSSLGAVCVDIPKFASINSTKGFEYGRRMLWHVIRELTGIFGRSMLYRTWDSELVALSPDTTQQIFYGKCARLQAALTRRYPREIRVGFSWSDKIFSGKNLVDEARKRMCCDSVFGNTRQAGIGKLHVVFCCGMDRETGTPCCAEALVRAVAEEDHSRLQTGMYFEPGRENSARNIDFFILDYVMKSMDRWRKEGYTLLPVLIRFSRETLTDPSCFASMLAIQSRYPKLDPALVRLGVSDRRRNDAEGLLFAVMEQFDACGIRMSAEKTEGMSRFLDETLTEEEFCGKYLNKCTCS